MLRQTFSLLAAALVVWAPVASADDPTDCDRLPPEQVQQCQQEKAAGIANQAIDEAKNGADKAKQAADQAKQATDQANQAKQAADQAKQATDQAKQATDQGKKAIDLSDKNCWLVNGVPTMWSPALVTGPGQTAVPCYSAYGLTPH